MTAKRNVVGTYRRKGTFRAQYAEKTGRAAQNTPLPPRCRDCRLPGTFGIMIDGVKVFLCGEHLDEHRTTQHRDENDDWECGVSEDHDWRRGDYECRRCGADLSEWNEEEDK